MKIRYILWILILSAVLYAACDPKPDADVKLTTTEGDIYLTLYDQAPKHKENFLKLAGEGFYDGVLFHRIINDFMIQTGDPSTKAGATDKADGPGYELDAEIVRDFVHTPGKLAAARMGDSENPAWRSSGSQFYIVTGRQVDNEALDAEEKNINNLYRGKLMQQYRMLPENAWVNEIDFNALYESDPDSLQRINNRIMAGFDAYLASQYTDFKYTPGERESYLTAGGAPWLDQRYTIFGEVVKGMEVVARIENTPTGPGDRPTTEVRIISAKVLKP
jgi:cyclophilin family peptidyl-prolyl cis-trans isomerase